MGPVGLASVDLQRIGRAGRSGTRPESQFPAPPPAAACRNGRPIEVRLYRTLSMFGLSSCHIRSGRPPMSEPARSLSPTESAASPPPPAPRLAGGDEGPRADGDARRRAAGRGPAGTEAGPRGEAAWSPRVVPAPEAPRAATEDPDIAELMAENLMLKAKLRVEAGRQDELQAILAEEIRPCASTSATRSARWRICGPSRKRSASSARSSAGSGSASGSSARRCAPSATGRLRTATPCGPSG